MAVRDLTTPIAGNPSRRSDVDHVKRLARIVLDPSSPEDYRAFLRVKQLPSYRFIGRVAEFPAEYLDVVGGTKDGALAASPYAPIPSLFDYQAAVSALAIRRRKFAVFMECGLGKSLIMLEFARHAREVLGPSRPVLIVSPLMVVDQTIAECKRFYGDDLPIERVKARDLAEWTTRPNAAIGITNYDGLTDKVPQGCIGALLLDESSLLKSHYGKWGAECIRLGKGLDWKLALTGTPAPNDRIEFANHAVFLDAFPTVNAFLARFFVNRGQTSERWELKPHALAPFYRALSHWSIFVTDPGVYGWKDNTGGMPPIDVTIHDVELTSEQESIAQSESGLLFPMPGGGIATRGKFAQLAKGRHNGRKVDTLKPGFIRDLVDSFGDDQSIVWCRYNAEQDGIAEMIPDAANIDGQTKHETRVQLVREFQASERRSLVSKPKILGFGLNLQMARHMVFSTLQDSWEEYHQAVKRANRYGATGRLNVHIPVTELERPMIETVLRKADRIEQDTKEQERIFKEFGYAAL
jgi:superfamily II DNA or RNA helicase